MAEPGPVARGPGGGPPAGLVLGAQRGGRERPPAMAAQPPPGPRKRSGPALCAVGWGGAAPPPAVGSGGALENGFPPHKRPRSSGAAGPDEGPGDPFGDNDDFTADDLEEIDILASQALSQEAAGVAAPRAGLPKRGWGAVGPSSAQRPAAGLPRGSGPAARGKPTGRCARAGAGAGLGGVAGAGRAGFARAVWSRVRGEAAAAVTWLPGAALRR